MTPEEIEPLDKSALTFASNFRVREDFIYDEAWEALCEREKFKKLFKNTPSNPQDS